MSGPCEHSRVELKLPGDPRAIGALGGAVEHMAQQAGFPANQPKEIAEAVEGICRALSTNLAGPEGTLEVAVEIHSDRLEVTLDHPGETPSLAPQPEIARITRSGEIQGLGHLDKVQVQSYGTHSRWTLVKYVTLPAGMQ